MRRPALVLLIALAFTLPARAVIIDSGDGTGNTSAPSPDPGWTQVGLRAGLNGVYLGYGWVVTAAHVGVGPIEIDGTTYAEVPGSTVWILHSGSTYADLVAYRIHPAPRGVAALEIPSSTARLGAEVRMIGWGRSRGAATVWDEIGGWLWGYGAEKRWGTNRVGAVLGFGEPETNVTDLVIGSFTTRSLVADFSESAPDHEGIVAVGDSGGGFFVKVAGVWKLGGISYALGTYVGQPASTSLYDNVTYASDLSHYRAQILAAARPCADGVDNDFDGPADWPADPECTWVGDLSELPDCSDGLDNDVDGAIDLSDGACAQASDLREAPDADSDGISDDEDDCAVLPDTPQLDSDQDGYGNACDADYDQSGTVGVSDFLAFGGALGTSAGSPGWNPEVDANGDGSIGVADFLVFGGSGSFGAAPGPSGLACAGTAPCP
jgi:hypothetical protein